MTARHRSPWTRVAQCVDRRLGVESCRPGSMSSLEGTEAAEHVGEPAAPEGAPEAEAEVVDSPQEAAVGEEAPAVEAGEEGGEAEVVAEGDTARPATARNSAVSARVSAASAVEVEPEVKELVADVLTRTAELTVEVRPARCGGRPGAHGRHTAPGAWSAGAAGLPAAASGRGHRDAVCVGRRTGCCPVGPPRVLLPVALTGPVEARHSLLGRGGRAQAVPRAWQHAASGRQSRD